MDRAIEHVEFLKLFFEVVYALPARIPAAPGAQENPPPADVDGEEELIVLPPE